MELDARKTSADSPRVSAAHTTVIAAPTILSLLATATTGSPAMDGGIPSLLPLWSHRRLSLRDFMDFLQRALWKAHHRKEGSPNTGR